MTKKKAIVTPNEETTVADLSEQRNKVTRRNSQIAEIILDDELDEGYNPDVVASVEDQALGGMQCPGNSDRGSSRFE